jgi:hypothetical protein
VPGDRDVRVVVRAPGFVEADFVVARDRVGRPLRVALHVPTIAEQVTVTASRVETAVARTPADVVVVSRATLVAAPALTLDDTLRQVPGFTLFRRTGSLVANPTSQGVSLRAVGASGASRALVLDDGVPVNDPFGGRVVSVFRAAISGRNDIIVAGRQQKRRRQVCVPEQTVYGRICCHARERNGQEGTRRIEDTNGNAIRQVRCGRRVIISHAGDIKILSSIKLPAY